jgi:hypothetical protein
VHQSTAALCLISDIIEIPAWSPRRQIFWACRAGPWPLVTSEADALYEISFRKN